MDFLQDDLVDHLLKGSDADRDAAEFGIVKLSPEGEIHQYNRYEAELAGLNQHDVIGENFFTQVAPCTNNFLVANRYQSSVDSDDFDEVIDYVFTYKLKPTPVQLRLLKKDDHLWLCVRKK